MIAIECWSGVAVVDSAARNFSSLCVRLHGAFYTSHRHPQRPNQATVEPWCAMNCMSSSDLDHGGASRRQKKDGRRESAHGFAHMRCLARCDMCMPETARPASPVAWLGTYTSILLYMLVSAGTVVPFRISVCCVQDHVRSQRVCRTRPIDASRQWPAEGLGAGQTTKGTAAAERVIAVLSVSLCARAQSSL
jgi:hypothetical protein